MKPVSKYFVISAITLLSTLGCQPAEETEKEDMKVIDIHSFAQPQEAVVTHLNWDADVNFDNHIITAKAALTIKASKDADQLVLDTKNLTIEKVTLGDDETPTEFKLGEGNTHMGQPLEIAISPDVSKVNVYYTTSTEAEAVQWLTPQQTADKNSPFLFTQSQAILARSWVPIQDSPGIRFTYDATVKVPAGLLALMSAENPKQKSEDGIYTFTMKQPIPAYLLALAVGDVEYAAISERSGVYAEPGVLKSAAYEFGELENMIQAAEYLYGKYAWEVYDIIVLPPSFPFGGMENPRLTFATPTILAGDRSLTSLVAHELAHSWSGNLVTNATWNDFWLNEGFTVYFEQRIMEALYGRDYSEMLASLSTQDLVIEVAEMIETGKEKDTRLKLELEGRNPDDGVTSIAYDKGYLFLRLLEEKLGREKFDTFLKAYFKENSFKVMTTEEFIEYLNKNLFEANDVPVDEQLYQDWIYGIGLPEERPNPVSDRFAKVDETTRSWVDGTSAVDLSTEKWSSHEWLHFVRHIPNDASLDQMKELDEAFGFTTTGNSEVLTAWLVQSIKHNYDPAYPSLERFLVNTGRRKFLMPLYEEMVKTDDGNKMANAIYELARPNYHFVSVSSIDALLGWND